MHRQKLNQKSPHEASFYTERNDEVVIHDGMIERNKNVTTTQQKLYATATNGPFIQIDTSNIDVQSKEELVESE